MLTALHVGDIFRQRQRGQDEYCKVEAMTPRGARFNDPPGSKAYSYVRYSDLPKGTVIHICVWKGDTLEVRKTRAKREDATTVPLTDAERQENWNLHMQAQVQTSREMTEFLGAIERGDDEYLGKMLKGLFR